MPTPLVSSLKSSSGSKSSNEDCPPFVSSVEGRTSFLRSSWISRLIPELPLPISWAEGPRSIAGTEDEDTDKRVSLSPFFRYQRQLANNFLGNSRADVPSGSSSQIQSVDIRPAKVLGLDKPMATSSAQHVARRIGVDSAAYQERAKDPAASTTFRLDDHRRTSYQTNVENNKRQSHGCPSEQEEPFSFWNMGRHERSNYVSSAAPELRASNMAHGRKRTLHSYELVSSKYRKRGSED